MSIWDKHPNYTDDELRLLVTVAAEVLLEGDAGTEHFPPDLLEISPISAARDLLPVLQDEQPGLRVDEVQSVLENPKFSNDLCIAILSEIKGNPKLAALVSDAYLRHRRKMGGPETILLAGALVVLAIKLKDIRWGSKGGRISFYESSETVKAFLLSLLRLTGDSPNTSQKKEE